MFWTIRDIFRETSHGGLEVGSYFPSQALNFSTHSSLIEIASPRYPPPLYLPTPKPPPTTILMSGLRRFHIEIFLALYLRETRHSSCLIALAPPLRRGRLPRNYLPNEIPQILLPNTLRWLNPPRLPQSRRTPHQHCSPGYFEFNVCGVTSWRNVMYESIRVVRRRTMGSSRKIHCWSLRSHRYRLLPLNKTTVNPPTPPPPSWRVLIC